ncbi:uncharacterized protein BXZ73DRAFT_72847 [Epithele typhae]|uniref:uncharacterized protein n=1 Tax=Epithele typhae TaxID=378194 RepID=UPI0020081FC9|nr:uncharacterized protein BXZ73DRAFT_72847 [Epithele typhae]KAH9945965.1 hypothetical protein BXZ73DRAFT_72847 [Epithele typhae]
MAMSETNNGPDRRLARAARSRQAGFQTPPILASDLHPGRPLLSPWSPWADHPRTKLPPTPEIMESTLWCQIVAVVDHLDVLVNPWPNTDVAAEEMNNLVSSPGLLDDSVGKRLEEDDPMLVSGLGEGVDIFITLPPTIPEITSKKHFDSNRWEQEAIDRFWNGPESPFEARDGIEYIRPDVKLVVPTKKVMIRQDYKDIWAHMALHPSESIIVIGHSGIGDFALVDAGNGPPRGVLALVDGYVGVGELCSRLLGNPTILSCSPQRHLYKEFQKRQRATFWAAKLWDRNEIFRLGPFPEEFYSPVEIMLLLGPCARKCATLIRRTSRGSKIDIGEAVAKMQPYGPAATLLSYTDLLPILDVDVDGCDDHFFMQPTVTGPRTSLSLEAVATCIIPTDFLFVRVIKVVIESGLAHREKMLRALKPLSAISDYAFKTLALAWCISDHLICQIDGKEGDFVLSDVMTHSFDDLPILGDQADDLMFVCPENFSTVDAFVVSADRSHIVFLQATIATRHPLKPGGVGQVLLKLLEHGVSFTQETRFSFIFVVAKDTDGQVLTDHFNGVKGFSQYSPEKRTHDNLVPGRYQVEVGYAVAAKHTFDRHQARDLDISLFPREALIEPEAVE